MSWSEVADVTILKISAEGAVLIAVILLLRRCLLNRLPKWTFLLLWAAALCRLLIPFTIPSPVSVYTGAARFAQAVQEEAPPIKPADADLPVLIPPVTVPGTYWEDSPVLSPAPAAPAPEKEPVSLWTAVYLTGAALCGLFFTAAYLWTLRRFWDAVPVETDFLTRWRAEHPTLFPVQMKVSRAVNSPLAYGLVRPVILLPETTDWSDEDQLTYILTHEYVHIRRGDLLWKLLLTAALCVHWFNPLVWVMYFRANRDLELACDEQVVRSLGLDRRKGYAYALLSAAESGFSPLCLTYTTKNHMEERIRAVMKMKKQSLAAILTAALLVTGVTAVFATSGAPVEVDSLPQAVQTNTGPAPAPADKSAADNRVHPVTPGDTSTPADNRVHPVTGQPAADSDSAAIQPSVDIDAKSGEVALDEYGRPIISFDPDEPAKSWGLPDGPIARGVVLNFHTEEEYRESIRLLRLRGYRGSFDLTGGGNGRYIVILDEDYDGVVCESKAPEGFMPDWTYPVNSKGETYGTFGMRGWVGYDPDLIAAVATNGAEGYMTAEDMLHGQSGRYPVYDLDHEHIVGYFEIGSQISSEVQAKIDELTGQENRWGVPAGEIPQWTEFTVADFDDAKELGKYLEAARGLYSGDYVSGRITNAQGTRYIVQITYSERAIRERLPDGVYPVNSKGETYGTAMDHIVVGYDPDLILVQATNGKTGYAFDRDMCYGGYPGEIHNPDDAMAYMEWLETQPSTILIPVYDVNRDNIIGYFKLSRSSDMTPEEELKMVEDQMRRNMGLSEEEIAKELEALKQSKGWN